MSQAPHAAARILPPPPSPHTQGGKQLVSTCTRGPGQRPATGAARPPCMGGGSGRVGGGSKRGVASLAQPPPPLPNPPSRILPTPLHRRQSSPLWHLAAKPLALKLGRRRAPRLGARFLQRWLLHGESHSLQAAGTHRGGGGGRGDARTRGEGAGRLGGAGERTHARTRTHAREAQPPFPTASPSPGHKLSRAGGHQVPIKVFEQRASSGDVSRVQRLDHLRSAGGGLNPSPPPFESTLQRHP